MKKGTKKLKHRLIDSSELPPFFICFYIDPVVLRSEIEAVVRTAPFHKE